MTRSLRCFDCGELHQPEDWTLHGATVYVCEKAPQDIPTWIKTIDNEDLMVVSP